MTKLSPASADDDRPRENHKGTDPADEQLQMAVTEFVSATAAPADIEFWTEEELDAKAMEAARRAAPIVVQRENLGFALGKVAHELNESVRNGAKRVRNNENTYERLSKKLAEMGVRKISGKRLSALATAHKVRESLGGKDGVPALSPDHFIEAGRAGLDLEATRKMLADAVRSGTTAPGVRRLARRRQEESGTAPPRDESYWHDRIERDLSRAQSIVMESYEAVTIHGIDLPPCTRDRLNHVAVLVYQFANCKSAEAVE